MEARDTGRIAAPARILLDTLKNLPDQPVTFTMDEETYTIEISSANGRYKLAGENAADFPRVPVVKGSAPIEMPSSSLAHTKLEIFKLKCGVSGIFVLKPNCTLSA